MLALLARSVCAEDQSAHSSEPLTPPKLAEEGVLAFEDGHYELAKQKLGQAFALLRAPSIGYWLGRSEEKLGHLVEAARIFAEAKALSPEVGSIEIQRQAQVDSEKELDALGQRIPKLRVVTVGASAAETRVWLEGTELPISDKSDFQGLNPGNYRLECRNRTRTVLVTVTLSEHSASTLTCQFGPEVIAPNQPTNVEKAGWRPIATYAALGIGAAGIVVGGVSGMLALSKRNYLDDQGCSDAHRCSQSLANDVDALNRMRQISTIGFIVGGVGVVSGVTLLLTKPRDESGSLAAAVGPQSVYLVGQF